MIELGQSEKLRDAILGSAPVIRQDVWLLIFIWIVASLPWIFGYNFIPYDSVEEFFPQSRFVVDSLRQGDLPWWNPYQYAGIPVFGDPQGMIFSLHTIAGILLGPNYTLYIFDLITLLHPLMGALALYSMGCSRGVPRIWLLSAAAVFMLGGVATSRLQHVPQIISYSWLPVLLWMLVSLEKNPNIWRTIIMGVVGGIWAANANQVVFLGGVWLALTAIYILSRSLMRSRLFFMYVIGGLTSLLIILPIYSAILEVVSLSVRHDYTLADSAFSSFPAMVFSTLILPALFGNLGGALWNPTDITQDFLYIGLIPVFLFLIAHVIGVRWTKTLMWIWLGCLIFFILYSMGVNAPVYTLLYNHFPGFSFFRRPADAAYLINFMLALGLIVVGREVKQVIQLNAAKTGLIIRRRIMVLILFFLVTVPMLSFSLGAVAGSRGAIDVLYYSFWGLLIRIILLGCIFFFAKLIVKKSSHALLGALVLGGLFTAIDIGAAGRFKGYYSPGYSEVEHVVPYNATTEAQFGTLDYFLMTRTAPWARVEVIGGFESLGHSSKVRWYNTQGYNPIQLLNYSDRLGSFITHSSPRTFPSHSEGLFDIRYDVLGLRYIVFSKSLLNSEAEQAPVSISAQEILNAIIERGGKLIFESDKYEVWTRPGISQWLSIAKSESFEDLTPAPCKTDLATNARLELICELREHATIVMGEVYAPGWQACVNGLATEVRPFFDVFRSFHIPGGKSRIVMTYQPVPFLRPRRCSN